MDKGYQWFALALLFVFLVIMGVLIATLFNDNFIVKIICMFVIIVVITTYISILKSKNTN